MATTKRGDTNLGNFSQVEKRQCDNDNLTQHRYACIITKAQIPLGSSRLDTTRHDTFDVSSASRRACRAVLFDKVDTDKMHGLDTSNVSCRVET